jgi:SSS family solute:Na+ symporter/sodium/proline symporter
MLQAKNAGTVEGFLIGGRNMGPLLSAFSYGTTYFSAVIFVGYAGMFGWVVGLGSVWIGVGNAIFGCLLAWLILAKPTRRMTHKIGARTMPEFFAGRYDSKKMKIYSALIIFIFLVPYAAGVYKGLGSLFSIIFVGADPILCMALVAILTAIYLMLGGYMATAWNDLIQGVIMIVGLVIMIILVVNHPNVGGISAAVEKLHAISPNLTKMTGGANLKLLCTNILLTSFGVWGMPQMVNKYYAVKEDGNSIKIATWVSTAFALLIGVGAYFVGSMGHLFVPAAADGTPDIVGGFDSVVPTILTTALSDGIFSMIILCIIMLLLLSASMSTLSSLVLSSSSAVAVDLIGEINPNLEQKSTMRIMRFLCFVFVLLSFIFASMNISFIVNLMSFSWGVVAGSFIGPFIWGLYKKSISKAAAWAGLLSGPVVVGAMLIFNTITLEGGFEAAKGSAPIYGVSAMAVSLIIVPIVHALTSKKGVALAA